MMMWAEMQRTASVRLLVAISAQAPLMEPRLSWLTDHLRSRRCRRWRHHRRPQHPRVPNPQQGQGKMKSKALLVKAS